MRRNPLNAAIIHRTPSLLASAAMMVMGGVLAGTALAKGPGKPPPSSEAANNISFPIILSDNVAPTLPTDGAWKFAPITDATTQCIGEAGVTPGTTVDPSIVCYYGRQVTVVAETGALVFTEPPKFWWLQKRIANFWKALTTGHDPSTPLVVSAVDVGDLLESSPSIATRQIRTEFNLLQHVAPTDPELGGFVVDWTSGDLSKCVVPSSPTGTLGCFAALPMSGAVPGTQQSGSEMQGTDFGPGPGIGNYPGMRIFIDPAKVRLTVPDIGGVQAVVYSRCARFIVQRVIGTPFWNPTLGQWDGAAAPVVNVAAYRNEYNAEITSGGSLVYGYNWNAKTVPVGTYRLTFVLDGNDDQGPKCAVPLLTRFAADGTQIVNVGENNPGKIVFAGDPTLGDEGGLAYVDLSLSTKGGGKN